ncbi:MAG: RDD family protein [Bacillota bacterium]|nr:RDD family protein [Bacillota bacterium]
MAEYKECPYCGEQILAKAIKCKHCQSMLDTPAPVSAPAPQAAPAADVPAPSPAPAASSPPPGGAAIGAPPQGESPGGIAAVSTAAPQPGEAATAVIQSAPVHQAPAAPSNAAPAVQMSAAPAPVNQAPPAPGYQAHPAFAAAPAPVTQGAPAVAATLDYPKAGLGGRILAYILDGFFGTVPFFVVLFLGGFSLFAAFRTGLNTDFQSIFGSAAAMLVLLGLTVTFLWALFYGLFRDGFGGRSWGKRFCGLMVVRLSDNRPCTLGLSFVRNIVGVVLAFILCFIPIIGWFAGFIEPIVAIVHAKGLRIGDMLAKTQVIAVGDYRG